MEFKEIKESLLQAVKLVECFEKESYIIDKESALDKIRHAYELLRFCENKPCSSTQCIATAVASVTSVCEQTEEEQAENEPEVEVEFILPDEEDGEESEESEELDQVIEQPFEQPNTVEEAEEPIQTQEPKQEPESEVSEKEEEIVESVESEQVEEPKIVEPTCGEVAEQAAEQAIEPEQEQEQEQQEPIAEKEPKTEEKSEPQPEPKIIQPQSGVFEQSLFGNDEQWSRPQPSRRKIMALYGEVEPKQEPKQEVAEPEVVEAPITESPKVEIPKVANTLEEHSEQVLGEAIESVPTIGDTILKQRSVAETAPVESLRKAISIADRFMLIRDLFGGDVDMYEEAIDTLDSTDNFDDCIIYITENFSWRPSSEGAKLIVDLLQRKFR